MNSSTEVTGRPLLLTVKAAAAKLGVSASMIRTLMERRTLPKIKLTNSVKGQVYTTTAAIEALAAASSPVVRVDAHAAKIGDAARLFLDAVRADPSATKAEIAAAVAALDLSPLVLADER